MTDERVSDADLMRALARLPRGSAVLFRHYGLPPAGRRALFDCVRRRAHARCCIVLLAGPASLAMAWGADGHHGRDRAPSGVKSWLHSVPVHDHRELLLAERAGAHVVLLSPLFATRSHPGARPLGPVRFASLARRARVPVIALGGVKPRHARLVRQFGASGFAAIDGLTIKHRAAEGGSAV